MPYVSLYRKYRSQTFDDVVGQDHVVRTLRNAIKAGRIAHGYLFCGSRGTGKTTVARLLAKALNCEHGPTPDPCNKCEACVSITAGTAVDVVEMDAASNRGIDDIRALNEQARYAPMRMRYKVYIIDEAHQITPDAKDAFLKTLEEPPAHVVFILATTEASKIPVTIRSRCQQFDFRRGTLDEISGRLRKVIDSEHVQADDDAIELIARSAGGSYRDALSVLEQVMAYTDGAITADDVYTVLGTLDEDALMQIGEVLAGDEVADALQLADRLLREGRDVRELLQATANHFRDVLAVKVGADPKRAADEKWRKQARLYSTGRLLELIEVFSAAQQDLRWSEQHRLALELAFLKAMTKPEPTAVTNKSDSEARPLQAEAASKPPPISEETLVPQVSPPVQAPTPPEEQPSESNEYDPYSEESVVAREVTLADVQRQWQTILRHMQKNLKFAREAGLAREGAPISLVDGVLTIGFAPRWSFHQKEIQTHADRVERAIKDVLRVQVKVTTATTENEDSKLSGSATSETIGDPQEYKGSEGPLLDNVITMFDGKIVEDYHDPWKEQT